MPVVQTVQGPVEPGECVVTSAGRLQARFVIHAVGPKWNGGTIGEYTTAGTTVNPALISEFPYPFSVAVVPTVPEPGSAILTLFGLVLAGPAIRRIEKEMA